MKPSLSSDRIRGPTRFGKALNLIFPKLSSPNMRGFGQRNDSYSQFPLSPQGRPGTMTSLLCPKYDKKRVAVYESRFLCKRH